MHAVHTPTACSQFQAVDGLSAAAAVTRHLGPGSGEPKTSASLSLSVFPLTNCTCEVTARSIINTHHHHHRRSAHSAM